MFTMDVILIPCQDIFSGFVTTFLHTYVMYRVTVNTKLVKRRTRGLNLHTHVQILVQISIGIDFSKVASSEAALSAICT